MLSESGCKSLYDKLTLCLEKHDRDWRKCRAEVWNRYLCLTTRQKFFLLNPSASKLSSLLRKPTRRQETSPAAAEENVIGPTIGAPMKKIRLAMRWNLLLLTAFLTVGHIPAASGINQSPRMRPHSQIGRYGVYLNRHNIMQAGAQLPQRKRGDIARGIAFTSRAQKLGQAVETGNKRTPGNTLKKRSSPSTTAPLRWSSKPGGDRNIPKEPMQRTEERLPASILLALLAVFTSNQWSRTLIYYLNNFNVHGSVTNEEVRLNSDIPNGGKGVTPIFRISGCEIVCKRGSRIWK